MKKIKILIIIILICITLAIISLLLIKNNNNNSNYNTNNENTSTQEFSFSEDTNSKLELVKDCTSTTFYLPFEDNGIKYLLLGYRISSYSNLSKSTMYIKNTTYSSGDLVIDLQVDEVAEDYSNLYDAGIIVDSYAINFLYTTIEIEESYNNVYIQLSGNNTSGKTEKQAIEKFAGGFFSKDGKYGYVDENINITIPAIYNNVYNLDSSTGTDYSAYAIIYNDNGLGIAAKTGEILMECQYGNLIYYGENTFVANKKTDSGWQMGVVDINNNVIIDFRDGCMNISNFTTANYATFKTYDNKTNTFNKSGTGLVDRNLNIVLEPEYEDIKLREITLSNSSNQFKEEYFDENNQYKESYIIIEKDGKRAVLDLDGNVKIDYCDLSFYDIWNSYENSVRDKLKI